MSVVSLNEDTKLNGLPKKEVNLDPQFRRTAEQLQEIERSQERLCDDCNEANDDIERLLKNRQNRLKYVAYVQDSSIKYWKFLGITVAALLVIKAVQGGMVMWSWFGRPRRNGNKTTEAEQRKGNQTDGGRDIGTSQPRLHARAWKPEH